MKNVAAIFILLAAAVALSFGQTTGPTIIATTGPATEPTTVASTMPAVEATTMASTMPSPRKSFARVLANEQDNSGKVQIEPLPMPRDFDALSRRNIFIKGRQTSDNFDGSGNGKPVESGTAAAAAADALILNGVTVTDQSVVAFIEDTTAGTVRLVQVGDAVAKGKIGEIDLDSLEYVADGKTYRVMVGQNLLGGDPVGAPSTQPTSMPAPGSADEILQRLKAKRLEELGQ
jgi:hypothetical protein